MSSSTLTTIQSQLSLYGYPIFTILGNIGNVLIVIIFGQHRQNACSIYLICSAIMNSIFLTFTGLFEIFPYYYGNETIGAFAFCKIRSYLSNDLGQIAKTMLVLACIDRFMMTSDRASIRAFSTPRQAKWLILFSILFWSLLTIHIPIMISIVNGQCNPVGIYSTIFTTYTIIFTGLIPPITLCIFGYLTYRNMRQRHVRVRPGGNNATGGDGSIQRRDRDLLVIVISEVFVYVVTATPVALMLLEMMISPYILPNKSIQYFQIEIFTLTIAYLLFFANGAAPFYTYLIASKSVRRDFKKLIINAYRKLTRQPTILTVPGTQQTLTQQRDTRV